MARYKCEVELAYEKGKTIQYKSDDVKEWTDWIALSVIDKPTFHSSLKWKIKDSKMSEDLQDIKDNIYHYLREFRDNSNRIEYLNLVEQLNNITRVQINFCREEEHYFELMNHILLNDDKG